MVKLERLESRAHAFKPHRSKPTVQSKWSAATARLIDHAAVAEPLQPLDDRAASIVQRPVAAHMDHANLTP